MSHPFGSCPCSANDRLSFSNSILTSCHRPGITSIFARQSGNPGCIASRMNPRSRAIIANSMLTPISFTGSCVSAAVCIGAPSSGRSGSTLLKNPPPSTVLATSTVSIVAVTHFIPASGGGSPAFTGSIANRAVCPPLRAAAINVLAHRSCRTRRGSGVLRIVSTTSFHSPRSALLASASIKATDVSFQRLNRSITHLYEYFPAFAYSVRVGVRFSSRATRPQSSSRSSFWIIRGGPVGAGSSPASLTAVRCLVKCFLTTAAEIPLICSNSSRVGARPSSVATSCMALRTCSLVVGIFLPCMDCPRKFGIRKIGKIPSQVGNAGDGSPAVVGLPFGRLMEGSQMVRSVAPAPYFIARTEHESKCFLRQNRRFLNLSHSLSDSISLPLLRSHRLPNAIRYSDVEPSGETPSRHWAANTKP
jgi:hypothetical protein